MENHFYKLTNYDISLCTWCFLVFKEFFQQINIYLSFDFHHFHEAYEVANWDEPYYSYSYWCQNLFNEILFKLKNKYEYININKCNIWIKYYKENGNFLRTPQFIQQIRDVYKMTIIGIHKSYIKQIPQFLFDVPSFSAFIFKSSHSPYTEACNWFTLSQGKFLRIVAKWKLFKVQVEY